MVVKGDADAALVVLQTWCQYAIERVLWPCLSHETSLNSHELTKHVENLKHVSSRSIWVPSHRVYIISGETLVLARLEDRGLSLFQGIWTETHWHQGEREPCFSYISLTPTGAPGKPHHTGRSVDGAATHPAGSWSSNLLIFQNNHGIAKHSMVKCQLGILKAIVMISRSDFHSTEPQFNICTNVYLFLLRWGPGFF